MLIDPTRGDEMQKTRPVVVLNPSDIGRASLRIVVPIIAWKPHYIAAAWMVELNPDLSNGLSKQSAADASQVRSVDVGRFILRLGELLPDDLDTVTAAAALCLGYAPPVTTLTSPTAV